MLFDLSCYGKFVCWIMVVSSGSSHVHVLKLLEACVLDCVVGTYRSYESCPLWYTSLNIVSFKNLVFKCLS